MKPKRFFQPSVVTAIGDCFVAVDDVQPVVVSVATAGDVLAKASWRSAIPHPPHRASWPRRRFLQWGNTLAVLDGECENWAVIEVDPANGAFLSISSASISELSPPSDVKALRSRFSSSTSAGNNRVEWHVSSEPDVFRWSAGVRFQDHEARTSAFWRASVDGSVSSASASRDLSSLSICLRRANKRPWNFRPQHDLIVLRSEGSVLLDRRLDSIDVSELCWPVEVDPTRNARIVCEYIGYSHSEYLSAVRAGGQSVQLVVRGIESNPVVELSFTVPELPGVTIRRLDMPLDELGIESGLRQLGVFIEEDLKAGVLEQLHTMSPKERELVI